MSEGYTIELGSIVTFVRGSTAPEDIADDALCVMLEHIKSGTGEVTGVRAREAKIKSSKFAFKAGDVLYGKLRPGLRKSCVADEAGYCSTDILPLRPTGHTASYYLSALLRSDAFTASVSRLIGGANLPRVNAKELLALPVHWPAADQLDRLDSLAHSAIRVRARAQQTLRQVDDFEAAMLAE